MRKGRRKGVNKEKVFGCDLVEHLLASSQDIPLVLRCCSEFIEEHGIVDGIYRLSGVSSNTQRLRAEFDEGSPDLNKDVYLQDIHCVSSLCKAYFRELPNPLLTYQLYDKFAEAIAIHLEDERLVKIKEVLKELPRPHHRTLEYLMHHLVRMAGHSSQTNMHARNLAIVWAPNLLRSKDIEATGFNGTAAFMEVRVQSVVVEFILMHVAQLFPKEDHTGEQQQSLPAQSPSDLEEKMNPLMSTGFISPGDGPLPMRPYHAIIESTDKRKGSLKSRKWTSIFNLGGRLNEKKNKSPRKDKEKTSLRPAKSMDSLSSVPFSPQGPKQQTDQFLLSASGQQLSGTSGGGEASGLGFSAGGLASGYAVTYRRGGGASVSMVSGAGTPGTYNRLDSMGSSVSTTADGPLPRSPATTSRAERRAGIHISGPFSVTVPLHITSGLALGVLHGAAGDKEEEMDSQREEDTEQGKREKRTSLQEDVMERGQEAKGGEKTMDSEDGGRNQEDTQTTSEEKERSGRDNEEVEPTIEGAEEEKNKARNMNGLTLSTEEPLSEADEGRENANTGSEEDGGSDKAKLGNNTEEEHEDDEGEYIEMKGHVPGYDDYQELPLDFQDTFGFLDLMDITSNQMNEFSVEPPCCDTYEEEDSRDEEKELQTSSLSDRELDDPSQQAKETKPLNEQHKLETESSVQLRQSSNPLICPLHKRASKSQSLPYKAGLFFPNITIFNEEDDDESDDYNDSDDEEDDEENFLYYSLPSSVKLHDHSKRGEGLECGVTEINQDDLTFLLGLDQGDGTQLSPTAVDIEEGMKEGTAELRSSHLLDDTEGAETAVQHGEAEVEGDALEQTGETGGVIELATGAMERQPLGTLGVEEECQPVWVSGEKEKDCSDVRGTACKSNDSKDHLAEPFSMEAGSQVETVEGEPWQMGTEPTEVKVDGDDLQDCLEHINSAICCVDLVDGAELAAEAVCLREEPMNLFQPEDISSPSSSPTLPMLFSNPCEIPPVKDEVIAGKEEAMTVISMMGEGDCLPPKNILEHTASCTEGEEHGGTGEATDGEAEGEEQSENQIRNDVQEQQDTEEGHAESSGQEDNDNTEMTETDGILGVHDRQEQDKESKMNQYTCETHDRNKELDEEENTENITEFTCQTSVMKEDEWKENELVKEVEGGKAEEGEKSTSGLEIEPGLGRTLVVSKQTQPKLHHAKAVPVVPPKPQLSKLAALNLRQHLQHRETERGKEGDWPRDRDKERSKEGQEPVDGEREGEREMKRGSAISMCFDEAVARATERRGKEMEDREREREKERGMDEERKELVENNANTS